MPKTEPTLSPPVSSGRFVFLDALRGLAAMVIAMHHIDHHDYGPLPAVADAVLPEWIPLAIFRGRLVVQIFLVISGFVIAHSLRYARVTPEMAGRFVLRRLLRLGLPYWTIIFVVLTMDTLAPRLGWPPPNTPQPPAAQVVAECCFLQDILGFGGTSTGLWFVSIEVQFTLLFIALLWAAQQLPHGNRTAGAQDWRPLLAVFLPLAALSLFLCNVDIFGIHADNDAWVSYFFGTFFLGIVTAWALGGVVPRWAFWLYLAVAMSRLALVPTAQTAVAIGATVTIYGVGRAGKLDCWLGAAWLQYLGWLSYSLFLVHYPVSHIVTSVGYRLTGDAPYAAVGWMVLALAVSLPTAHLFCVLVEAPASGLASRLKRPALAAAMEDGAAES